MTLPVLPPWLLAGLLALGVLLAWARLLTRRRGASTEVRGSRTRFLLLCALQPVCALLLYFTLLPPRQAATPGTLVVMTANAGQVALPASPCRRPRPPTAASACRTWAPRCAGTLTQARCMSSAMDWKPATAMRSATGASCSRLPPCRAVSSNSRRWGSWHQATPSSPAVA